METISNTSRMISLNILSFLVSILSISCYRLNSLYIKKYIFLLVKKDDKDERVVMNSTRTDFDLELKEGFSLNELLLLAWINGKHVDTSEYPQYFSKNLEIEETILRLFDDDCLDIIEGEAAIDFLTLEKLNDIFKENKLQSFKDYEKAKNFFLKRNLVYFTFKIL